MGYVRGYEGEGGAKSGAMVFLAANLRIRLTDPQRNPVPGGRCRMPGNPGAVYTCDGAGIVEIPLEDRSRKIIDLEWEGPAGSGEFAWSNSFEVDILSSRDEDCGLRLTHLGFPGEDLPGQVSGYQGHFGREPTGRLSDIRDELVRWHDGGGPPRPGGPGPAPKPAADPSGEVKALAEKLYLAFNDSGFLGMGGTDEEGVLGTLRTARDKGLMRAVEAQYRKAYPGEPGLKEELDDELSGEEFETAMRLYDEGMQAQDMPGADTGSGPASSGPAGMVLGTLAPGSPASVQIQLLDHDLKPMPGAACRLASKPDQVFRADEEGWVELPIHAGVSFVEIEWEAEDAAPDESPDLPRFYYGRAVPLKDPSMTED